MSSTAATPRAIAATPTMGTVALTVPDLDRSRSFYESAIGLRATEREDGALDMGVPGEPALVRLHGVPGAPPFDPRRTGLFHLALLVPSRRDLAEALARLAAARWPLTGASDHLVSEALYLRDPDGNGIEIYRDRDRAQWRRDEHGQPAMDTLRLDLRDLAGDLDESRPAPAAMPEGTTMGHVHLQVADIPSAQAFHHGILGFDVTARNYPGALFVSAGGYHHHVGLNTWNSAGAAAPLPGSTGLRSYEIRLPDDAELERVLARVREAGLPAEESLEGTLVRDPSGNAAVLTTR